MSASTFVRILNGGLDEEKGGEIVLRGRIDPATFIHLKVDDYQREVAPLSSQGSILRALETGGALPDVELGMRGHRTKDVDGNATILLDDVYIIDGLQRISTAKHYLGTNPGANIRIGAKVRFDTTMEWERHQFRILNSARAKVSPNVLLRNLRVDSRVMLMLYGLSCTTRDFVLHNRVSWGQRMNKGELVTALTFAKAVGNLHSHKAAGKSNNVEDLVPALDRSVDIVGIQNMRDNIRMFYDLIDECWGIRRVQYRQGAAYMRSQFLFVLARLLSDHQDFWKQPDEKKLFIEASLRRKLAMFPVHDPQVQTLAGSSGKAREMLYMLLRDHINSGKRTKRLTSRKGEIVDFSEEEDEQKAA